MTLPAGLYSLYLSKEGPRRAIVLENERTEAVSTTSTKGWMLHTPNTVDGISEATIEDRARTALNESTTQRSGFLPDNLGEVRGLREE